MINHGGQNAFDMWIKLLGSLFVIIGCGSVGFGLAASQIREENSLRKLLRVLDFMYHELRYKMTPLPELCDSASKLSTGIIHQFFASLYSELSKQNVSDVKKCVDVTLAKFQSIPQLSAECISELGISLGRFDIEGQLTSIDSIRDMCKDKIAHLNDNKEVRLRCYRTLGICFGAALVILFI